MRRSWRRTLRGSGTLATPWTWSGPAPRASSLIAGPAFKRLTSAGIAIAVLALVATASAVAGTHANPPRWTIKVGSPRAFAQLSPGATETIPFRATTDSRASQAAPRFAAAIPQEPNGDAETTAAADLPGCLSRWFTATVAEVVERAGGYDGAVALTMLSTGTNQDACRGKSPAVTVTAAG